MRFNQRAFAALACVMAAFVAGCGRGASAPKSGGLEVVIDSDMTIPRDLDHVSLVATQGARTLLQVEQDLGPGALLIPTAFAIKPTGDASPVTIKAVAYQAGQVRVERDAVTPIPEGREGALRLALNYLCVGTATALPDGSVVSTCPGGLTCVQGTCQTSTVLPAMLPTYDPESAPGAGGASGGVDAGAGAAGCFDVQGCFADATAALVDATTCSFALPADVDPAVVNVGLQFLPGGAGVCGAAGCWVVLDAGADWTAAGGTVQLPAAVCTNAAAHGGAVVVATGCHPKTEAQPSCGPWSSSMTPAPQPKTPAIGPGSCVGEPRKTCGLCGVQTRMCLNGEWSDWGVCTAEGACLPASTGACGANGTQTCGAACQWGACGCPADQTTCAGTCTSVQTDLHNCGACGNDCTLLPHVASGSAQCVAGRCTYACANGYADCGQTGQGCGASFSASTSCGRCDVSCGGATPTCAPAPSSAGGYACASGCTDPAPTSCGGSCVDLRSSAESCGKCGNVCPAGASCKDAQCTCPGATVPCGSRCVDLTSENENCGKCGNACPDGSMCHDGACDCVGPTSQACGACGGTQLRTCTNGKWSEWSACTGTTGCTPGTTKACTNGTQTCDSTCQWGACQCATGFQTCSNNTCANTQTDSASCGKCGHACPTGSMCQNGACACPAGATTQACGRCGTQTRSCNDGTWSAWSACGGEGVCMPAETMACNATGTKTCTSACQWGGCVCSAATTTCGTQCVNLQTDAANCGGCGKTCAAGMACVAGVCGCPSGTQNCGGTCVHPLTDAHNCGGCGNSCPVACASGLCCDPSPFQFVDDDVVKDPNTGLSWTRGNGNPKTSSSEADSACRSMSGGPWRLPTHAELVGAMGCLGKLNTCAFKLYRPADSTSTPTDVQTAFGYFWSTDKGTCKTLNGTDSTNSISFWYMSHSGCSANLFDCATYLKTGIGASYLCVSP